MQRNCKYKDSLGEPGKGFHKHFGGVAVGDFVGTAVIAAAISYLSSWSFWIVFLVLFIVAEFLHWYFCVDTAVLKYIKWTLQSNVPIADNGH